MTIATLVERERQHLRITELAAGALLGIGAGTLLVGAGAALLGHSRWLALPRVMPFIVWLLVASALGAIALRSLRRLAREGSRGDVALAIEEEQGLRRGLLVGALELEGQGGLAARAAQAARAGLPVSAPLAPALRRTSSRRTMIGAAAGVAGVLVLSTASPLSGDGLRAVLRPVDAWRGVLLAPLRITDAPRELVRGAPLALRIVAPGRARVFLSHRQTGDAWITDTIAVLPGDTAARWKLPALHGDLRLVATDGRAVSDSVVVHAVDRPFVGAVTLHVDYPAYLSRAPEMLPVGEPLRLPRGTVLSIAGRASVPLTQVTLRGAGSEMVSLPASGQTFAGRMTVTRSAQLHWSATGPAGAVADVPPPLELVALADAIPSVTITSPTVDTLLATDDHATLAITASDDHGLARIELRTFRDATSASSFSPVAGAVGTSWAGTGSLDIAALRLAPGDVMRVRVEAADASPWAQRGVSRELVIKRPTMEERRDAARALGESAVAEARAAASAQRSLAQRTDEAARAQSRAGSAATGESSSSTASAPDRKPAMNYEAAEKARGLAQEQRTMADRVQKLREATQQMEQQLKAAGALDTSLARQLGEAQELMRQALTPQLAAQMQKLEGAVQQMNGEQSRTALRDLAQMQQRMREQLEKSAEMLKRAAHEGAMQTLADQAKELAQQERALAEKGDASGDSKAEPAQSAKLAQQAKRLREQMSDLKDRLTKDKADAGASRTEQAGEHAAKSETAMRRASTEGKQDGAAAKEMEQAAASMQDARAAQVKDWKQELTSELDQSVQEMMQLAREERALEQKARSGAQGDDQRGAQSAVEQGVGKANERLQGAAKKSALLSPRSQRAVADARDKVSQATQKVSQSGSGSAGQQQQQQASALGEAADALTKAAAALARDRERANSAGSASGFGEMLQELQQAAQKQGQINGQAQSLMSMPGGASGEAGQSLARSLARQQRGVADQLEDAGDAAGGDRAAQLAREARQLADQLDGGRLDPGTLARQQQLFRRLLDAGRSLEKEEREDSGKREAKTATGTDSFTPNARVDAKAGARFRPPTWEELRGLSADERRAILDYFTRLNNGAPR